MRGLICDGSLQLRSDLLQPVAAADQILLRPTLAGICNTDLEIVRGYMHFSGILGHEFVARVEEGPAQWIGRRVVGEINVACGNCDMCRKGVPSQCRNRTTVGIDRHPGAMAEYMSLALRNLYVVPDEVPDQAAVFVEPLAAALQILEAIAISPRDHVVLIGAGKLGMLIAQVLKLTGADLSVVVRREKQAKILDNWGIRAITADELTPRTVQVVVDATGVPEGFATALNLVAPRGAIVLKSTYVGIPQADLTRVVVDEIRVIGSRCGPFDAALRLLQHQLVDVEPLIEAQYSLADALRAFDHAAEPGAMKILLRIAGE